MIKFTARQRAAILKMYLSGVPVHYIAKTHGCSDAYPSLLAKKTGNQLRGNNMSRKMEAKMWARACAVGPVIA